MPGALAWPANRASQRAATSAGAALAARGALGPPCCEQATWPPVLPPPTAHVPARPPVCPSQILEECGFDVPVSEIRYVTSYVAARCVRGGLHYMPAS